MVEGEKRVGGVYLAWWLIGKEMEISGWDVGMEVKTGVGGHTGGLFLGEFFQGRVSSFEGVGHVFFPGPFGCWMGGEEKETTYISGVGRAGLLLLLTFEGLEG